MNFENKVVLITGGAGGIGFAIAQQYARLQAKIMLIDINKDHINETAVKIQLSGTAEVIPQVCDISKENEVQNAVAVAMKHWGRIDVIVNNAGLMLFKKIEEQTIDDWLKIFNVDLFGSFFFIKHAFLNMKPGGTIVNVSSIHAIMTEPMVAPYAAAKAALLSLTRSAAIEGKPKGIRVNAVLPGAIDTPMLWENPNVKAGIEQINQSDVGRPEDIAKAVVYLSSDDAAFIQGTMLTVDGGRLGRL